MEGGGNCLWQIFWMSQKTYIKPLIRQFSEKATFCDLSFDFLMKKIVRWREKTEANAERIMVAQLRNLVSAHFSKFCKLPGWWAWGWRQSLWPICLWHATTVSSRVYLWLFMTERNILWLLGAYDTQGFLMTVDTVTVRW